MQNYSFFEEPNVECNNEQVWVEKKTGGGKKKTTRLNKHARLSDTQ